MKIGILALQGAFREHVDCLERLAREDGLHLSVVLVRNKEGLADLDGLIIPGGESTSMTLAAERLGMWPHLKRRLHEDKLPVWGTCAGAILLSKHIDNAMQGGQDAIAMLDISIKRNAYGSQSSSFIAPLTLDGGGVFPRGVFIRAPRIDDVFGSDYKVIARLSSDASPVAVRSQHALITTFHPELTDDLHFHRQFIDMMLSARR